MTRGLDHGVKTEWKRKWSQKGMAREEKMRGLDGVKEQVS